ncbi:MAG: monovalent cation/H+ antiporter subunit D family protein [Planctomycetota bacterium]|nr:monovalent cation/H+ antiporter subunit D family protein [Planctomycetota bacterium]
MSFIDFNLPVLLVIVPLLGGVLSVVVGSIVGSRKDLAWGWALAVSWVTLALVIRMLLAVVAAPEGFVVYNLGSWPGPWGIEYRVDHLNAFVLLVVAGIGAATTLYARHSVADEIPDDRHHAFYCVWLLAIAGLLGITVTGDTFNVYVLLEISSLTSYALIAMGKGRDRRALLASLRYLILGTIGASFILVGIGYLLMLTGTLNMADMHERLIALPDFAENRTVLVAFAFLLVGLSVKMALFPLHMWLPGAYTHAPSAVSALLASTATKVGVYMAFRFMYTIFGRHYSIDVLPGHSVLLLCAALAVLVPNLTAIRQTNVKRLLAYSSVGQIGYMVMGFALANEAGMTGSIVHLFNHAAMKGGMFLAVGAVVYRLGRCHVNDFTGLGKRMPWTMGAFSIGGLGLVGFPLTAGFVSKWFLVKGCIEAGLWPLVVVVLIGSLLAVIYTWKLLERIWFTEPPESTADLREAPPTMLISTWALILTSVYFGVHASFTVGMAQKAAAFLLETTQ